MNDNPYLKRKEAKSKQSPAYWKSKNQERKLAKELRARRISGSGSGRKKGDVYKPGVVRIEAKTTSADSFRVTKDMVNKITYAGIGSEEIPVIAIDFLNSKYEVESQVVLIPKWALDILLDNDK